ncbi:MAG: GNAT family N-acetyltransferase [Akkermansiaceae bacterium]|nr:GNAT family N-acetyltransferase [Akkermansiaceae bacterium]
MPELDRRDNCHLLLGMDDDTPVGVTICFEVFSSFVCKPVLNIHDFAISSNFQGKGLATILLKKVEALANELGCCKITLEVLEGNAVAKHVYEKFGFVGYELDPAMGKAMFMEMKLSC